MRTEDVLISMRVGDGVANDYQQLKAAFEKYFVPRRNVIYERARVNLRCQLEHEAVETFTKELHRLAETCDFGSLQGQLIRDRLVVGLRDRRLSERLQLDSELKLEKAVSMARNSEAVKGQQSVLRGRETPLEPPTGNPTFDALTSTKSAVRKGRHTEAPGRARAQRASMRHESYRADSRTCKWCGSSNGHPRTQCPAQGKTCMSCKKVGHFASVCMSSVPTTN
ncbi:uncharacterized protein LOC135392471 [Ornithodoros turicata]|uniref:uncharacterized protein LOC135392471 n=1 Tax=Ornithodoros turicata TaxID=34597 RepID=UPI00313A19CF